MIEIIKEELNIKSITFVNSKGLSIQLDAALTPKLEAEGFANELIRNVQAARKKANLVKENEIDLEILFEYGNKTLVEKFIKDDKKRIGAKTIHFKESKSKFSYSEEGKIKEKNYRLSFNKL